MTSNQDNEHDLPGDADRAVDIAAALTSATRVPHDGSSGAPRSRRCAMLEFANCKPICVVAPDAPLGNCVG